MTVEEAGESLHLDIRAWAAQDFLHPGRVFTQTWTEDDTPVAAIQVEIARVNQSVPTQLWAVLQYRAVRPDGTSEPVRDEILLDQQARGFATARRLFVCPNCMRRVTNLYPQDQHFRCRRCGRFGYQSQRHSRETRGLERVARIKRRLGGTGEPGESVPDRPKGMHRATYERLCAELAEAEAEAAEELNEAALRRIQRLLMGTGLLPEGNSADLEHIARAAERALLNPELLPRRNRSRKRPKEEGCTPRPGGMGRPFAPRGKSAEVFSDRKGRVSIPPSVLARPRSGLDDRARAGSPVPPDAACGPREGKEEGADRLASETQRASAMTARCFFCAPDDSPQLDVCIPCAQVIAPIWEKLLRKTLPNPMSFTWGSPELGPAVRCSGCARVIRGGRLTFPDGRRRVWKFHHPHCSGVWHRLWGFGRGANRW